LLKYTTVDPAPPESRGLDPDYNVVLTTGIHPTSGRVYVLDYWRARGTPKEVIDAIFDHVNRFNPLKVGIESVGYQQTLSWWTREMQVKQKKYFIVEDLKSGGRSKPARIKGLQPVVAAHGLYLLPWMDELRQEFVAYPRGAHDDVIDALAYQLSFWQHTVALEQEQRELEADKRTGAKLLAELHDRFRRPQTYPYDMLGRSESGALVADVSEETHGEHFQYTHYFGGLFSGPSYRN
jgi:predicted phage terminase large subunit-like protein